MGLAHCFFLPCFPSFLPVVMFLHPFSSFLHPLFRCKKWLWATRTSPLPVMPLFLPSIVPSFLSYLSLFLPSLLPSISLLLLYGFLPSFFDTPLYFLPSFLYLRKDGRMEGLDETFPLAPSRKK
jgi:hypothetical protein